MPDAGGARAALLGAVVVLLVALAGCGSGSKQSPAQPPVTAAGAYPMSVPAGSVVLFDIDAKRLVTFDRHRKAVTATGNAPQTFQYPFPDRQDLLTSGSSTDYGFELLRVTTSEIRSLVKVSGRRGLFPLASDGDRTLLVLQQYDARNRPASQQVVRLDGSSLVPVAHLDHRGITGGALLHGVLSYTVLRSNTHGYDLRRVDLRDPASRPRTLRSGLRYGALHTFRGRLVVDFHLGGGGRASTVVDCDGSCTFSEATGVVVTVAPNANNDRELRVFDPRSRRTFGSVVGPVVGFTMQRHAVDVYGKGLRKRISLAR